MTSPRPAGPLLAVKHTAPPVRPGSVERSGLVRSLRDAVTRLTLVAAPAGWGKTSLLGLWAADPGPDVVVAWVSLDEGDDDPVRFWRYALTALHEAGAIGPAALDAVVAPGTEPIDLALPILLNELAASSSRHVLVLDDYHVLTDARIHESLEYLVGYLPPALRIVVAGRADPPLPLARLRARGELTELRADDLRFTLAEAAELVGSVSGRAPDDGDAAAAWRRTEGWAAGLHLVGLALRGGGGAGDRHVLDYLASEVLPSLDRASRDLLVATAPLERLSGALCDAALGTTGSALVLDGLDRADLFVTPMDAAREWYRCHPLLRDALLRESRDERAAHDVLARAAAWYAGQDRLDDAVHHHLLAGDPATAARLLRDRADWFLDRGMATTFLLLGERLPEDVVTPQLAFALAYAARPGSGDGRVAHWLDLAERGTGPDEAVFGWHDARAAVLTMRAVSLPESQADVAVELAERAVALEDAANAGPSPAARAALGSAYARSGRFTTAAPMLLDSWRQRDTAGWTVGLSVQIGGLLGLVLLALDRGDDVDRLLRQTVPLADTVERDWGAAASPVVAALRVVQGRWSYLRGDVREARDLLDRATVNADADGRHLTVVAALVFLADAELGVGHDAAARAALARAREFVEDNAPVTPVAAEWLERAEQRIGRVSIRAATRPGGLVEPLTDRELSILRVMPGSGSQREIAAALHLSINTVKAYTKSLYRKLGVGARADAVSAARHLGLI
ncbi:LuxR C-terminal-related transcriptional regulator [Umezawaea sp. NPDC059074]|uniref:LuxR C-terminal-related transcriptional regulator n=1 Tax=Umezawaea sp. NPDC059074 TaxID=3346716 RepID=UPI0036C22060